MSYFSNLLEICAYQKAKKIEENDLIVDIWSDLCSIVNKIDSLYYHEKAQEAQDCISGLLNIIDQFESKFDVQEKIAFKIMTTKYNNCKSATDENR